MVRNVQKCSQKRAIIKNEGKGPPEHLLKTCKISKVENNLKYTQFNLEFFRNWVQVFDRVRQLKSNL